ncbi:MAG: DJ-1/PfpI family protein [bacterium]|nr:DJ-1/PfpI family protein [bacterium]
MRPILFKIFFLTVFIFFSGNFVLAGKDDPAILFIIPSSNFRDEELFYPMRVFKQSNWRVDVVSSATGSIKGMLGNSFDVSTLIYDVNPENYDVIVFVGGSGAMEYWDDKTAHEIAIKAASKNKILGASCIAPVILANAGVLKNVKVASWPSVKNRLKDQGALFIDENVVVDGLIVTAGKPEAAEEFGEALFILAEKEGYGVEY